ncbi:MAG: hypothetical protein RLO81_00320 [Fulvivirga sp.]|uniref:hypothetical protein n=1 Tax=Fulvivirga sp. TaxID=1931237 RepID=UPI0032EE42C0
MKAKFSPSVNIIRDEAFEVNYLVTPNAKKVAKEIEGLSNKDFRAFTIIGSYGSGKSSFLWALEKDIKRERSFFDIDLGNKLEIVKLLGEYASLQEILAGKLNTDLSVESILTKLRPTSKKSRLVVIDEFGKFVEYAVRNEPEKEIYFFQQLAEFVSDPDNNCILITTLHQSFDAYSSSFLNAAERNEWRKVKGRFKDLTFNEPVEQLLFLAAQKLGSQSKSNPEIVRKTLRLQKEHTIVKSDPSFLEDVCSQLWPLDIFSAYILSVGLQRYGQNERSLFTFLEGELDTTNNKHLIISDIYDYLNHEFYSQLRSQKTHDYSGWRSISVGLERTENLFVGDITVAQEIIKIIGLVTLLGHKGAKVDQDFLTCYLDEFYSVSEIKQSLEELEAKKIILYTKYNNAYRIIEGTDVDFAEELKQADREVDDHVDVSTKLKEHFQFSVVNAKAITYRVGTPRFFEYVISEKPIQKIPTGQIDGFINLLFDESLQLEDLIEFSKNQPESIYAVFRNVENIKELLIDIERTLKAKSKHTDDKVARKEFENIFASQKQLLNRNVLEALFTDQVSWYYKGENVKITSQKELNKSLSQVCELAYPQTPIFRNELINRHVMQGGNAAKKPYFEALASNYHLPDLGFKDEEFPPQKTIYLTLLKETGIHVLKDGVFKFQKPTSNTFKPLWEACEAFLLSTKSEKRKVTDLYGLLATKPFKLTPGFLDFWIPTFLFIKRDDFALFSDEEAYQPELTDSHLYFFTRDADKFSIKAFDVEGVKLDLYNKYRELLQLRNTDKVNNQSLIESVKPFMVFYHHLNEYAKNTKRLSTEAIALRKSIEKAEDPEKLFFEEFPKAVNVELKELLDSKELFDEYILKLRGAIRDLQSCFDQLVDSVEKFIVTELLDEKQLTFQEYKSRIEKRFANLREHMLRPQQTALLVRLRSTLDDRNSWINSICHVVMGKSLELLRDKDEELFKDKLGQAFQELDNLLVVSKASKYGNERVLKVDITSLEDGTKGQIIHVPEELDDKALDMMNNIKKALGRNKNLNKFILLNLLKQQLDD